MSSSRLPLSFLLGLVIFCCFSVATASSGCKDILPALLKADRKDAVPFCSKYLKLPAATVTVATVTSTVTTTPVPVKKLAVRGFDDLVKSYAASKISSACSCLSITKTTVQVTATTTQTYTPTPTAPACTPTFTLNDVSESTFNPKNTPFTVSLSCPLLNSSAIAVLANWEEITPVSSTPSNITLPGFADDHVQLSIFALGSDVNKTALVGTFELLFGSTSMPVQVLDPDGNPAAGVYVQANATTYTGVSESGYTDDTGRIVFDNLPATTIGLVARRTEGNQLAVNGLAATGSLVTLQLMPFNTPSNSTNFDFSEGTEGWTGGTLVSHSELRKRQGADMDLSVSTNNSPSLQKASGTFKTFSFTKTVYVRYRFQTDEVPGGYFGTQYNDYYSVTIRSDLGGYAAVSNSMNQLGLGAFDASGATQWYTMTLDVPAEVNAVQFDIAVSNVGDAALQSQVIVDKAGDLTCEECGNCDKCPGDPMCQDSCTNPPAQSCAFYSNCVEQTVPCSGKPYSYAINYGDSNCNKYRTNLAQFSAKGQDFIWGTMSCLQHALIPAVTCDATCQSIYSTAFNSHPGCYVDNGFCGLSCSDYVAVIGTVGKDLLGGKAIAQEGQTAVLCAENFKQAFSSGSCLSNTGKTISQTVGDVVQGILDALIPPAY